MGPSLIGRSVTLRFGGRWRDLPFAALGEQPSEKSLMAGMGFTFGGNRALLDLSLERARRRAGDARENAWVFGAGLTVRP